MTSQSIRRALAAVVLVLATALGAGAQGSFYREVQKDGRIRFAGPDRVRIERAAPTLVDRFALVKDFIARLA